MGLLYASKNVLLTCSHTFLAEHELSIHVYVKWPHCLLKISGRPKTTLGAGSSLSLIKDKVALNNLMHSASCHSGVPYNIAS